MARKYSIDEVKYRSHFELIKICEDEKIIEGTIGVHTRQELINIVMKYRGDRREYSIDEVNPEGLDNIQDLMDERMTIQLGDSYRIEVPNKMTIYNGLDVGAEDSYRVRIPENVYTGGALLVNANNYLCGIFNMIKDMENTDEYLLASKEGNLRMEFLKNERFYLVFFKEIDAKHIHNFYYGRTDVYPHNLEYYKVPLNTIELKDLEVTRTPLCIDFGTTNTTAGAYLSKGYVGQLPENEILNGRITTDSINYVDFGKSKMYPTVAYVRDLKEGLIYGQEVLDRLRDNNYLLNGSVLYQLKDLIGTERTKVIDEGGNTEDIGVDKIIGGYIRSVIERAKSQFKCDFERLHITSPVKLKGQFLDYFEEILPEYKVIREGAIDEGIAVMYNTIEKLIKKGNLKTNEEYKALIVDSGGGTTELASCKFSIGEGEISYELDIETTYENSEERFGGNNLTYRIMQYLKVIMAGYYEDGKRPSIDEIIPTREIYRSVDRIGVEGVYEKLDELYAQCEDIIPTRYNEYLSKSSYEYERMKNNFYFLWEASEALKKEFFDNESVLRTMYQRDTGALAGDIHITPLNSWNLSVLKGGYFVEMKEYPSLVFNLEDISRLLKGDVYSVINEFLEEYYYNGELMDYSIIKLSGQSCKAHIFYDVLKEFVPGKMINQGDRRKEKEGELKLNCLDGAIKYLNSVNMGELKVNMINNIPKLPYSVGTLKYNGDEKIVLDTETTLDKGWGSISKVSTVRELILSVKGKKEDTDRVVVYKNIPESYARVRAVDIEEKLGQMYSQWETDEIQDGITKFFVYTMEDRWGFYVMPVTRQGDDLYMGGREYFPFEGRKETSFFNGMH